MKPDLLLKIYRPAKQTALTVALLVLFSGTQAVAQAPKRFPGLIYKLADINTAIENPDIENDSLSADQADAPDAETVISPILQELGLINELSGPYDPKRMRALTDLGFAYQEFGAHTEAITAFEEALQLYRIKDGLNSIQQISIVDAIAESEAALQNLDRADNMESLGLHVISRTYPEGSDVLTQRQIRKANWNIRYFLLKQLYLHQSDHYRMTSNSIINDNTGESSVFNIIPGEKFFFGHKSGQADTPAISSDAFSEYSYRLTEAEELLNTALTNPGLTDEEKISNLKQLAAIQWYREAELYNLYYGYQSLKDDFQYLDSGVAYSLENTFYRRGINYLTGALEVVKSLPDSSPDLIARSMMDLADWDMVFYRHGDARDKYLEVYEYLQREELSENEIDQIMNPSRLLKIPAFATHQYELPWWQGEIEANGLVEVDVTLRRTGKLKSIDISELTDPGESQYIRSMLRSYLQDGIFRPEIQNGEPVEVNNMNLLFEYSY